MAQTKIPSSGLGSDLTLTGTTYFSGNILPTSNNTVNIGSPDARFGTLYISANTIDLGGAQISATESGSISFATANGNLDLNANTVNFLSTVSEGTAGQTGYTGSRGTDGVIGVDGYTGSQGDTGLGFAIAKSYASIAALEADTAPTGIAAGQFAIIETGSVDDADNSRLYLWSGSAYSYVTDLSGAAGITGPAGPAGSAGFTGSAGTNGFTGSSGTGFTGSAGTNATNGTATFVATGTIGNGTVVALNSNGTVSVVAQSDVNLSKTADTAVPSSTIIDTSPSGRGVVAVYNTTENLVYVLYRSGSTGNPTIAIGTISGSVITFTASTNFNFSGGASYEMHYNATENRVAIVMTGIYGSDIHAIVGTPTPGPGLSFGTLLRVNQWSDSRSPSLTYVPAVNRYVVSYSRGSSSSAGVYAFVMTIAGTSFTMGSEVLVANGSDTSAAVFDPTSGQVIVAYKSTVAAGGSVRPLTVSGTSISVGSATQFSSATIYSLVAAYNTTDNNMLILVTAFSGSNGYFVIAGSVSGSTFTFGNTVSVVADGNGSNATAIAYDPYSNRYILFFSSSFNRMIDVSVSGTTPTIQTTTNFGNNLYAAHGLYLPFIQKVFVSYTVWNSSVFATLVTGFQSGITNAGSWIGISANSAANAGSVLVTTLGGVNTSVTGLTTNTVYYVNPTGDLTATPTSYGKIGIATATNKILLTDTNYGYTGSAGAAGFTGSIGFTGSRGTTGFVGSVGFVGSAGVGFTGSIGYTGSTSEATTVTVSPVFKGALVTASATQSIPAAAYTTLTQLTTVEYDTNNFTSTASRFTIPAGVSKVKLQAAIVGASQTDQWIARIRKNGAEIYSSRTDVDSAGGDSTLAITPVLSVVEGDYFEVQAFSQLARNTTTSDPVSWFSIEVVEGSILDTTSVIRTTGYTGSAGIDGAIGYTGSAGTGSGGGASYLPVLSRSELINVIATASAQLDVLTRSGNVSLNFA